MKASNIVKPVRLQKGLTRYGLAKEMPCSYMTIKRIEEGKTDPSVSLALQLAKTLDTPVDTLFML